MGLSPCANPEANPVVASLPSPYSSILQVRLRAKCLILGSPISCDGSGANGVPTRKMLRFDERSAAPDDVETRRKADSGNNLQGECFVAGLNPACRRIAQAVCRM